MSEGISFTDVEIEQERLEELDHIQARMDKPIEVIEECYMSELGTHEALHASFMLAEMASQFLLEHPAIALDPIAWKHAHDAHTALFNLYQRIGHIQFEITEKRDEQINLALLKL